MKNVCLLVTLFTINSSLSNSQTPIDYSQLVERQNITYRVNSEVPFTGKTVKKYHNGQKQIEGSFSKGIRDGKWTFWYDNGQKEFEGSFRNGQYHGKIHRWLRNGQVIEDATYVNGIRNGFCRDYYINGNIKFKGKYRNGLLDSLVSEYADNGVLTKEAYYTNGVLNGSYFELSRSGISVRRTHKNGLLNGDYIETYANGIIAQSGKYINGRKEGTFVLKYDNNATKQIATYKNGINEGSCIFYSNMATYAPDQKTRAEMFYVNGKLQGKYTAWQTKGMMGEDIMVVDVPEQAIKPPSLTSSYEKMEGCFVDGAADGIFKYWHIEFMKGTPTNTYSRQIWKAGQLLDNGGLRDSWIVEFESNGNVTKYYKDLLQRYDTGDRFTKKYNFPCEKNESVDNTNQESNEDTIKSKEIVSSVDTVTAPQLNKSSTLADTIKDSFTGNIYIGDYKDGKKHGYGKMVYKNGSVYEGEWKDDKRNGKGTYSHSNGSSSGEFLDGKLVKGDKVEKLPGYTRTYSGEFRDGALFNGNRITETSTGLILIAEYKNGVMGVEKVKK